MRSVVIKLGQIPSPTYFCKDGHVHSFMDCCRVWLPSHSYSRASGCPGDWPAHQG